MNNSKTSKRGLIVMKKRACLMTLLIPFLLWAGCSKKSTPPEGNGVLRLYLTDSVGSIEQVNLIISQVSVHTSAGEDSAGWIVVNDSLATYDLMQLANGATALLGEAGLVPGHYTQIRLLLIDSCQVVSEGESYPLHIPSGSESGIKLNHQFEIEAGKLYELLLDFDAQKSIISTDDGYLLKPVIRVVPLIVSGTISGTVHPLKASPYILATSDGDTIQTTHVDSTDGNFSLIGLPEGYYDVHIEPTAGQYVDTTLTGVKVSAGEDTDLGVIVLRHILAR